MLQIQDGKVWQVSKLLYDSFKRDDQKRRLDPDNITQFKKQHIKPLYPHKINQSGDIQKYSCCQSCCSVDPGRFCCCSTTSPDASFQKLGIGLCLYFKFLKHSSCVFMFIAFLTLITCAVCYLVAVQNNFSTTEDYQTFLYATTFGVFSSEHVKCSYKKIPAGGSVSFTLNCPYGVVNPIGTVYSTQSLNTLYNCKNQILTFKSGDSTYAVTSSSPSSSCTSSRSCTYTFTPTSPPSTFTTIAYSYECLDQTYTLSNYSAKSQYLFYGVVGMDIFCCLILTLFYCSETKAQEKQIQYFKQQQLSLNDFSIKMKGLNMSTLDQQFNEIYKYFQKIIGQQFSQQLIQIKTPDRVDFVQYQNNKNEYYEQLTQFITENYFDLQLNPNQYKNYDDFINRNFAQGKYQIYKKQLLQILNKYYLLEYNPKANNINKNCSIFLVFNSIKLKNKIYQLQQQSCFSKFYQINGKRYKLSQPPVPDQIIWKNKGKWTFIRVFISWILTFAICFGSYMLFGFIQYKQNQLLSGYNFSINCDVLYTSAQMTIYSPIANDNNYLPCFCKTNLFNFSYNQCNDWRNTYFTYLAIPIIISLFLVIYNVVVSTFFKLLSKFQSHRLATDQLYSYTIKRSFLLVMNMALIMIILNMKYSAGFDAKQVSFLLQGKYNDLTPDWYINIGTIIIMTMIFNISFPIVELILTNIIKCFKKCWDTKCCLRKTSCKTKQAYIELFSNDIYPIEERYAFLISIILITLTFSCIIPILNIISALSLMLLYFSDRVLVFKVYQTPMNYGSQLHKLISQVIYIGLLAHFALSAYFLSQPTLIAANSGIPKNYRFDTGNQRINSIISTNYIIPYVVFFGLFIGWSIFRNTLIAFCKACCNCLCNSSQIEIDSKYKIQQKFYDSLSNFQIARLRKIVDAELNKVVVRNSTQELPINYNPHINDTIVQLNLSALDTRQNSNSQHQALLKRTLLKLGAQQTLRKRENEFKAQLIGFPSYQVLISEQAFDQDKKINELDKKLKGILRGLVSLTEQ